MSFSTNAKDELIRSPMERSCCMLAELAALTQTTGSLGFRGAGKFSVTYRVENAALARRIYTCLKKLLDVSPQLHFEQHARLGGRTSCVLTLQDAEAQKLLMRLGMMEQDEGGSVTLRRTAPRLQMTRQCCRKSFLRGVFLGAGSITSPEKDYYLELVTDDEQLCQATLRLMEKCGLAGRSHVRNGKQVIYLKSGQQVVDFLALTGAPQAVMEMENIRITRQMRGDINRASNCDDHNYERTVSVGESQVEQIKQLALHGTLSRLPKALQEMAKLRLEHPDMSLTELGQQLDPPVGKSGVNHRLQRLLAIAASLEEQTGEAGEGDT